MPKLSTVDHKVMSAFLSSSEKLTGRDLATRLGLTESQAWRSACKLSDLGFIRCVSGSVPAAFSLVLDCPYFPPVAIASERVFSFEDPELKALVENCEKNILIK